MKGFVEVRDPVTGRLLFTFNPDADIIHMIDRNHKVDTFIHLGKYRNQPSEPAAGSEGRRTVS